MQITPSNGLLSALSAFSQSARAQAAPVAPVAATQTQAAAQSASKPLAAEPSATPFGPKRYIPLAQSIDIRV